MSRTLLVFLVGSLIALILFLIFGNRIRVLNPKFLILKQAIKAQTRLNGYPSQYNRFIMAQAMHETGFLRSNLFRNFNNAFGMKYPKQRTTVSIGGTKNDFARYKTIEDSVIDLLLWFNARRIPKDINSMSQYAAVLKARNYYEDTFQNYFNGLTNATKIIE